jgi:hypothetical protein
MAREFLFGVARYDSLFFKKTNLSAVLKAYSPYSCNKILKVMSMCLFKHCAMKVEYMGGSGSIAPPLLLSVLDGGEWSDSASHPGRFNT